MRIILLNIVLNLLTIAVCAAQIGEISIGVDGLTCAQCSRSVEMQLRRLPFVETVQMDLQEASGVIKLRADRPFVPEAVANAVKDAGFSLRYLKAIIQHPEDYTAGSGCFTVSGNHFQAVPAQRGLLPDNFRVQFLGRPFQPGAAFKKQAAERRCGNTGKLYFVTLARD